MCNRKLKVRTLVLLGVLCAGGWGSSLYGAFAVDPAKETRERTGGRPSFVAEIDRAMKLGKITRPAPRPRRDLPGTLLARTTPVKESGAADPARRAETQAVNTEEKSGSKNWQIVLFLSVLALAGYAFYKFRK